MNQTLENPDDQPNDLNQNQPENINNQNPNNNTRNVTIMNPSPTQHITSNTYVFTTPIKLTQNNFMLWRSQVVSSTRANELEGFINGSYTCPPRCFTSPGPNQTVVTHQNLEYQIWKKQDHILLSWLLSSLSEGVLGTVVDCSTSHEVWTTLTNQYGARTRARILYLRTQIQTTKKGSLTIHEYYSRMKTILNTLRAAGNNMNDEDFILCVLAGVGSEYDSVVTNINSMPETPSLSEVYSMLLSQETRTEQNLSPGTLEANFTQMRNGRRNWGNGEIFGNQQQPRIVFRNPGGGSGNGGNGGPGQGNQNGQDKGKAKAVAKNESSESKGPCQICFKMGHTAAECWHRFKKNYVPQPNRRRGAYMATAEGQSSNPWYLDSGATNHVTNAIGNMNRNSEYQGNDKLTVGNGNKLHISHIGYSILPAYCPHKHIKLNYVLCVPDITKNIISVSKLLHDNDIDVEFQKSVCFIKDKSQGRILVKGVARDGLYELLCMPTHLSGNKVTYAAELSSSSIPESISCISNPMSMACFNFSVDSNESLGTSVVESSRADTSSRNFRTNEMDLWHLRLGHPNESVLKNTLLSCNQLNFNKNIFPSFCDACQYGKQSKLNFKSIETKTSTALELIHKQLPSFGQEEACQNLNLNTVSDNHTPTQLPPNSSAENCILPPITKPNTQASLHPMITRSKAGIFKPKVYQISTQSQTSLPPDSTVALKDPKWRRAMEDEYNALVKNQTWTLIPHDQNYKLIGNKWVYKVKENPDGTINRYKAKLVLKGFLQTPGLDFNETFSPVVKAATIRIILTLAVNNDWLLRQVDINNVFLNGDLTETVYMPQPEGFEDKRRPNHICKLQKALYGLRQAPRAWFDKLKNALCSWGFNNSKYNKGIEEVIGKLSGAFALKDLGNLSYFIGIQVIRNQHSIMLSQAKYVQDLLAKTEMENYKGIESPFSTTEKLKKGEGTKLDNPSFYRSVVGSLQYAVLIRPELAYSVNKLSQYMSDPRQSHWTACKRVLRYLKSTGNMCLKFQKSEHLDLIAYTDADWASDQDDRRSISGYCVFLGDNLVAWSSRKQGMVARSTAESEYRAIALCTTEITWISSLFGELEIDMQRVLMILSDSTSAAAIATNPVYHSKTKHFEIDLHFIRDKVTQGELEISFVASRDQVADILTKPLPYYKFSQFRSKLNVFDKTLSLREGVENSDCEDESTVDPKAMLACHLSNHIQQPADVKAEVYSMSWQNSYAGEYLHVNTATWSF
ncbi:retrovirus-related pol polyprotein from transposon RE1 [Citrus sinensis]|nr:retrovirus-related pol polyprotein from transposon RE1 [Citrus sinensis]